MKLQLSSKDQGDKHLIVLCLHLCSALQEKADKEAADAAARAAAEAAMQQVRHGPGQLLHRALGKFGKASPEVRDSFSAP